MSLSDLGVAPRASEQPRGRRIVQERLTLSDLLLGPQPRGLVLFQLATRPSRLDYGEEPVVPASTGKGGEAARGPGSRTSASWSRKGWAVRVRNLTLENAARWSCRSDSLAISCVRYAGRRFVLGRVYR